jgi:hypothetical protein
MRAFRLFSALSFALCVLFLQPARAQVELEDDSALPQSVEEIQLEVLVFRFPGKGEGSELKANQSSVSSSGQAILGAGSEHYSEVNAAERQLSGAYSRAQASSDMKPMLFTAWKQNLSDQRWVSLKSTDGISGRLLLNNGKPLSLKLELQLDETSQGKPLRFRMKQTRPAHFDETLYFDHPAFGALVRINLVK